jgi:DNA-binding response OmpR family regulator
MKGTRMKILVIDDDPSIRILYKEELEEEGYTVLTAESGKEAMHVFEREQPHLVTLDILMPGINGVELLNTLKEKYPDLPVVMNTAYPDRDTFAVWEPDAYIAKSSDMVELKKIIRELLPHNKTPRGPRNEKERKDED